MENLNLISVAVGILVTVVGFYTTQTKALKDKTKTETQTESNILTLLEDMKSLKIDISKIIDSLNDYREKLNGLTKDFKSMKKDYEETERISRDNRDSLQRAFVRIEKLEEKKSKKKWF